MTSGQPVLDLSDTNPANAGSAWSSADHGPLLRRDGVQRQDPNPLPVNHRLAQASNGTVRINQLIRWRNE